MAETVLHDIFTQHIFRRGSLELGRLLPWGERIAKREKHESKREGVYSFEITITVAFSLFFSFWFHLTKNVHKFSCFWATKTFPHMHCHPVCPPIRYSTVHGYFKKKIGVVVGDHWWTYEYYACAWRAHDTLLRLDRAVEVSFGHESNDSRGEWRIQRGTPLRNAIVISCRRITGWFDWHCFFP